jgi:hypothetical protein
MNLQQHAVSVMSVEQLISFGSSNFYDENCEELDLFPILSWKDIVNWVTWFLDEKPRQDFSPEAIRETIEEWFPSEYHFDGDTYVSDPEIYQSELEESVARYEEIDYLPQIGKCKFYPTLGTIVFKGINYYEDSNIFNDSGYTYKRTESVCRISVQEYEAKILAMQEKMTVALLHLKRPTE